MSTEIVKSENFRFEHRLNGGRWEEARSVLFNSRAIIHNLLNLSISISIPPSCILVMTVHQTKRRTSIRRRTPVGPYLCGWRLSASSQHRDAEDRRMAVNKDLMDPTASKVSDVTHDLSNNSLRPICPGSLTAPPS